MLDLVRRARFVDERRMGFARGPRFAAGKGDATFLLRHVQAVIFKSCMRNVKSWPNSYDKRPPNRLKICYFGPPGVSRGVWSVLGRLGEGSRRFSGASWGPPGAPWGRLGASWGRLGAPRGPLGRSWGRLGLVLGRPGAILGGLGRVLARSLGVLGGIVVNPQKLTKT